MWALPSSAVLCVWGWSPLQSKRRALDTNTSPGGSPELQPFMGLLQTLAVSHPGCHPGAEAAGLGAHHWSRQQNRRQSFICHCSEVAGDRGRFPFASEWGNCVSEMLIIYCDDHKTPLLSCCHWLFFIKQILISGSSTYIYMKTSLLCDKFCVYAKDRHPFSLILGC